MSSEPEIITVENGRGIFHIVPMFCKGCGLCMQKCPVGALGWSDTLGAYGTPIVEPGHGDKECIGCDICTSVCPDCAIFVERVSRKQSA